MSLLLRRILIGADTTAQERPNNKKSREYASACEADHLNFSHATLVQPTGESIQDITPYQGRNMACGRS